MWTLDELVERVGAALAAEYPGAPNGRVRDVPDRRAIRWYTTIGLVDRPLGMRGRTALYGPRHLQQLVAIKRWQAQGRSLSQIQAEFVFLTPRDLTEASRTDKLAHTVGYDQVVTVASEAFRAKRYRLVEAAAGAVAEALLDRFKQVVAIRVTIHKPHAPIAATFDDVGVSIHRKRQS